MVYVVQYCRPVFDFEEGLFIGIRHLTIVGNESKLIGKAILGSRNESELILLKDFEKV